MHEAQADIMCFQEHNLVTEKHIVRHKLKTVTKQQWPHSKLLIAQSPITYTSVKKFGGTMQIVTGKITGNVSKTHTDYLGQ